MKKKKILIIFCILLTAVLAAGAAFLWKAGTYKGRFLEGTSVNGVDAGGRSVDEVADTISDMNEKAYSISIAFRDGSRESLDFEDVGYRYDVRDKIQALMDEQDVYGWMSRVYGNKKQAYTVTGSATCDAEKIDRSVRALPETQESAMTSPTNASISWDGEKFVADKETEGNELDVQKLSDSVISAVKGKERDVSADGCYIGPSVRSTDKKITDRVYRLNYVCGASVTYSLPDGSESVIDRGIIHTWAVPDSEGYPDITDETIDAKCAEYMESLSPSADTEGCDKVFHSTLKGDIVMNLGEHGFKVDREKSASALSGIIKAGAVLQGTFIYSKEGFSTENNGFGYTYIEVDIRSQHLWFYKDGNVVWESSCVSGTEDSEKETPSGVFAIYSKERNRTLNGPSVNGHPSYQSFVSYWMPFYQGCGLHDASWRSSFGGSIYLSSGSHGCVNLPTSKAGELYSMADRGTPVIVFRG